MGFGQGFGQGSIGSGLLEGGAPLTKRTANKTVSRPILPMGFEADHPTISNRIKHYSQAYPPVPLPDLQ